MFSTNAAHLCERMTFDQWRVVDTTKLHGKRRDEFERDQAESNRRYDQAFSIVLAHTSPIELREFWRLFSSDSGR